MTTTTQTIPASLFDAMQKYYVFSLEEECVPGQAHQMMLDVYGSEMTEFCENGF